ncbi:MAG: RluA family pseudouridine synthase [Polyangiaceae bacterium]|nr:RluA family pseudouridine synthase [Polyangiaceae bacterium]
MVVGPQKKDVRPRSSRAGQDAVPLDRAVKEKLSLSWNAARDAIRTGKVFVGNPGVVVTDPTAMVRSTEKIELVANAPRPHIAHRSALERGAILHLDPAVVVVNKPAGISTVPFGDETPEEAKKTLDSLVREILSKRVPGGRGRAPLGVVHRLDKETSGVMLFTRTLEAKKHLAQQFREHSIGRRYTAIVHGSFIGKRTIRSFLVEDRGDGLRGSARPGRREGQLAITHVKALQPLAGATLVSCELETGRTHQIRIHLSEAGHPIVGESVYIRNYAGPRIAAPRAMLHAAELTFEHPTSGEEMSFSVEPPEDFRTMMLKLR